MKRPQIDLVNMVSNRHLPTEWQYCKRFHEYHEAMVTLAALLAISIVPVSPTAPNRQPQLAADKDTIAMVFGSGDSIWMAQSADHGRSFGVPAKVADLPKLMLGRHRGP